MALEHLSLEALHYQPVPTWGSSDVHCFEISGFDDGDGKPASRGEIAQWKHQLSKVHIVLQVNVLQSVQSLKLFSLRSRETLDNIIFIVKLSNFLYNVL